MQNIQDLHKIWQRLTAPRSADADEARREYMTKVISLIISIVAGGVTLIFGVGWGFGFLPLDSLLITCVMTLIFGGGWWLSSAGHWRIAGYFPPVTIVLTAAYGNWIGGAGAPAMVLYALAIALTAVLQNERAQWITLMLSVAAYVVIGWGIIAGYIVQMRFPETAFANRVVIVVGVYVSLASLLWFLVSQFRLALTQSRAYAEKLMMTNRELQQEIVERRRAEEALRESREKYKRIIENSHELICETDAYGKFTYINSNKGQILGYNTEELLGTYVRDLLHPDDKRNATKQFVRLLRHGTGMTEFRFRHKDRSWHWIESSCRIYHTMAGGLRAAVFSRDITERKQAEAQIRKLNEELEQRVAERTTELQTSLVNLKRAQKHLVESEKMAALGGLVAGVAHEVNTPIGVGVTAASYLDLRTQQFVMRYGSNLLTRADLDQYVKIAAESASIILSNLDRAANLIKSFKRVAVDQSLEEKRRFDLREYLDDILFSLRPHLKKTKHTVRVTSPEHLELMSYPGTFSQIFSNLIMNSLNHGFDELEKGEITITLSMESSSLLIIYRDNGKGIAAEHLSRIFEPFFTTRRTQNSTGLGMYIVYNLVTQQLNGTISYESEPGRGTTFYLEIPGSDLQISNSECWSS